MWVILSLLVVISGCCTAQDITPAEQAVLNDYCKSILVVGKYYNYLDATCKSYVYCYQKNSELVGLLYTCVGETVFYGDQQLCKLPTSEFVCNSVPPVILPPTQDQSDPALFCETVNTVGKFRVLADTTCKRYINCYAYGGKITGAEYTCAGTTSFNEISLKCELNVVCT